jgi:hypothetical protein
MSRLTGVYARFRLQPVFGPAFTPGFSRPKKVNYRWIVLCQARSRASFPSEMRDGRSPVNGADSAANKTGAIGLPGVNVVRSFAPLPVPLLTAAHAGAQ